jgi:hypothetical protein
MSATEIIPQLTGLIGVAVGLGGVAISYITLRHSMNKSKPQIKVEISEGFMLVRPGETSDDMLMIKVANYGEMNFTVANLGIQLGRHSGGLVIPMPLGTVQLPHELQSEKTCDFWTNYADLKKDIKKMTKRNRIRIRVRVRDYVGRSFTSNTHLYVINETKPYKAWLATYKTLQTD